MDIPAGKALFPEREQGFPALRIVKAASLDSIQVKLGRKPPAARTKSFEHSSKCSKPNPEPEAYVSSVRMWFWKIAAGGSQGGKASLRDIQKGRALWCCLHKTALRAGVLSAQDQGTGTASRPSESALTERSVVVSYGLRPYISAPLSGNQETLSLVSAISSDGSSFSIALLKYLPLRS